MTTLMIGAYEALCNFEQGHPMAALAITALAVLLMVGLVEGTA